MFEEIYLEKRSYEKYDNSHYIAFMNEKVIENYVPESVNEETEREPVTAYSYTGDMKNGGTLIESLDDSRDNLINGIIRSKYTQSEEDAIKTHQIIRLTDQLETEKLNEYKEEWEEFNLFRETAKNTVDSWLN